MNPENADHHSRFLISKPRDMPNEDSTLTEEAKVLICELEAIWDDVGESDSDRVQMLNELREEHIAVIKKELDRAIQRKIHIKIDIGQPPLAFFFEKDGITWTTSDLKDQIESLIKELKELQGEEKEIAKKLDELYEFLIKNITLLLSFVAQFVATLRMYNGVTCGSKIAATTILLVLSVILLFSPVRLSKEKYEDAQVMVGNHNKKKSTLVEYSDVITKAFFNLENETFKGDENLRSEEELEESRKSIKIIYSTKVNVNLLQMLTSNLRSPTILSRWYQRGMSPNSIVALILAIGIAIFICVEAC